MSSDSVTSPSSDISSAIRPGKYNGKTNFSAWKLKILAFLQSLALKQVVVQDPCLFDHSTANPGGDSQSQIPANEGSPGSSRSASGSNATGANTSIDNTTKAKLKLQLLQVKKKSEKAYAIILNSLEDDVIDLVAHVEAGDAFKVWAVLLETYEAKTIATMCHKMDLLMNIRFSTEKESFDVLKARFTKLVLELKEMGECVSSIVQRYVLLRALPKRFEALVQSLKINDTITIDELCAHVKDFYESEKRRLERLALVAKARKRRVERIESAQALNEKNKRSKGSVTCYNCGGKGHIAAVCPTQKSSVDLQSDESEFSA